MCGNLLIYLSSIDTQVLNLNCFAANMQLMSIFHSEQNTARALSTPIKETQKGDPERISSFYNQLLSFVYGFESYYNQHAFSVQQNSWKCPFYELHNLQRYCKEVLIAVQITHLPYYNMHVILLGADSRLKTLILCMQQHSHQQYF
jgi:hypothetical protein